jgi:hypothetical protein
MADSQVTRREFLERVAILGAAIGAAPVLAACSTKEAGEAPAGTTGGAMKCDDVSKLTDAEKKTRTDLQYVEASVKPDQNCSNCQQFKPGADANTCGTCTLVPGPINSAGWCLSWVAKVS